MKNEEYTTFLRSCIRYLFCCWHKIPKESKERKCLVMVELITEEHSFPWCAVLSDNCSPVYTYSLPGGMLCLMMLGESFLNSCCSARLACDLKENFENIEHTNYISMHCLFFLVMHYHP